MNTARPDRQVLSQAFKRNYSWLPDVAWAALVVAGFLLAGVLLVQRSQRDQIFTQLAEQHVAAIAGSRTGVSISSRDAAKSCFEGKLPFELKLPDMPDGASVRAGDSVFPISFLGCRIAYVDQAPGAQLILRYRQHCISVFVFRNQGRLGKISSRNTPARRASFNMETWTREGIRYASVGDARAKDIHEISEWLRKAE
ncbi:MAG: hypothetical protein ACE14M_04380 [Terriglobales bacterium]